MVSLDSQPQLWVNLSRMDALQPPSTHPTEQFLDNRPKLGKFTFLNLKQEKAENDRKQDPAKTKPGTTQTSMPTLTQTTNVASIVIAAITSPNNETKPEASTLAGNSANHPTDTTIMEKSGKQMAQ